MTILASVAFGLELTEWLVIGGACYGIAELAGLSRSARTIRRENADLRHANQTLEKEVAKLDAEVKRLDSEVKRLEASDQKAVLAAITAHDEAMARFAETLAGRADEHERQAQTRRGEQKAEHAEAMTVFHAIRKALEKGAAP